MIKGEDEEWIKRQRGVLGDVLLALVVIYNMLSLKDIVPVDSPNILICETHSPLNV